MRIPKRIRGLSQMELPGQAANFFEGQVNGADTDIDLLSKGLRELQPGPLECYMFILTVASSVLIIMASVGACKFRKCLTYWDYDASNLVREYIQKMSIYNLLVLSVLYFLYTMVFNRLTVNGQNLLCFELGEHRVITLFMVTGSLVGGLLRYLGIGFGHSEHYSFGGTQFKNRHDEHIHKGFAVHSNATYKKVIAPYLKMSAVVIVVAVFFLFVPIRVIPTESILKQSMCLVGMPQQTDDPDRSLFSNFNIMRVLSFSLLIALPVLIIVLIEHCCHIKTRGFFTKIPGYYTVLNAPFVMVAMSTTWTIWLSILMVTVYCLGAGAGEYFAMLTLMYTFLDSMWLFFITIIIGLKGRK